MSYPETLGPFIQADFIIKKKKHGKKYHFRKYTAKYLDKSVLFSHFCHALGYQSLNNIKQENVI